MAKYYFDEDADLSVLEGKTVASIGYGNQGRSQALNLRDSEVNIIVGNIEDEYKIRAQEDGFDPIPIPDAAGKADVLLILIPDEVQPEVYEKWIRDQLKPGDVLCFAAGYNIFYGFIEPPPYVDVVMVAPRMLGRAVRSTYVDGTGFPSFIAVHQDYSGEALERTLAISKGIGSTKMGVLMSSFEEETVVDLFTEHGPGLYAMRAEYEALVEAGYSPDAIIIDMYASGESVAWAQGAVDLGTFERMLLASPTAQFGHLVYCNQYFDAENARREAKEMIEHITNGDFAHEWAVEQAVGQPRLKRVWERIREHPMMEAEHRIYQILGRRPPDEEQEEENTD